jgi:hypothetical protein
VYIGRCVRPCQCRSTRLINRVLICPVTELLLAPALFVDADETDVISRLTRWIVVAFYSMDMTFFVHGSLLITYDGMFNGYCLLQEEESSITGRFRSA